MKITSTQYRWAFLNHPRKKRIERKERSKERSKEVKKERKKERKKVSVVPLIFYYCYCYFYYCYYTYFIEQYDNTIEKKKDEVVVVVVPR